MWPKNIAGQAKHNMHEQNYNFHPSRQATSYRNTRQGKAGQDNTIFLSLKIRVSFNVLEYWAEDKVSSIAYTFIWTRTVTTNYDDCARKRSLSHRMAHDSIVIILRKFSLTWTSNVTEGSAWRYLNTGWLLGITNRKSILKTLQQSLRWLSFFMMDALELVLIFL